MNPDDVAFEVVASRRPGCGAPNTLKRRAWVHQHLDELRAEEAKAKQDQRQLTIFDTEVA